VELETSLKMRDPLLCKHCTEYIMYCPAQAELKTSLKTWEPLLYEQNAMVYLLRQPERLTRVAFESEYCINCAWAHGLQGKLPFLKRFSECSFCTGFRNSREVRSCLSSSMLRLLMYQ